LSIETEENIEFNLPVSKGEKKVNNGVFHSEIEDGTNF